MIRRLIARLIPGRPARNPRIYRAADHPVRRDQVSRGARTVVLVPYANPLGLAQQVLGHHEGRFDLRDGVNFNRQFADLTAAASAAVQGRLGDDPAANVAQVRAALRDAAAALSAKNPAEDLKRRLLALAIDADIVLDLHCDAEASVHLYGLTPQAELCAELGALLGARAILLATESGDSPFDEACSRPWFERAITPGQRVLSDPYVFFTTEAPGMTVSVRSPAGSVIASASAVVRKPRIVPETRPSGPSYCAAMIASFSGRSNDVTMTTSVEIGRAHV